jgi:DNA-binding LytR/AlgR family response regulator
VDLAGFVFVHNSSLLNVSKIAELETRGNINLALFEASSGHREMLLISRRGMAALAAKILLRQSLRLGRVSPACPADADS